MWSSIHFHYSKALPHSLQNLSPTLLENPQCLQNLDEGGADPVLWCGESSRILSADGAVGRLKKYPAMTGNWNLSGSDGLSSAGLHGWTGWNALGVPGLFSLGLFSDGDCKGRLPGYAYDGDFAMGENADLELLSQGISVPDPKPLTDSGNEKGLRLFSGRSDSIALTMSSSQAPRINSKIALLWCGNIRWSSSRDDLNVSVSFLWGDRRGTFGLSGSCSRSLSPSLEDLLRFCSSESENLFSSKLTGLTGSSLILRSCVSLGFPWAVCFVSLTTSLSASEGKRAMKRFRFARKPGAVPTSFPGSCPAQETE